MLATQDNQEPHGYARDTPNDLRGSSSNDRSTLFRMDPEGWAQIRLAPHSALCTGRGWSRDVDRAAVSALTDPKRNYRRTRQTRRPGKRKEWNTTAAQGRKGRSRLTTRTRRSKPQLVPSRPVRLRSPLSARVRSFSVRCDRRTRHGHTQLHTQAQEKDASWMDIAALFNAALCTLEQHTRVRDRSRSPSGAAPLVP